MATSIDAPKFAARLSGPAFGRRLAPADRLTDLRVRDHARRNIAACLRLGKLPQLKELRLAAWAHMLGFRGHPFIDLLAPTGGVPCPGS